MTTPYIRTTFKQWDWWGSVCRSIDLYLSEQTRIDVQRRDRALDLAILADRAAYDSRRMKRRAQKAHSRACRLRWMAEQARASG